MCNNELPSVRVNTFYRSECKFHKRFAMILFRPLLKESEFSCDNCHLVHSVFAVQFPAVSVVLQDLCSLTVYLYVLLSDHHKLWKTQTVTTVSIPIFISCITY